MMCGCKPCCSALSCGCTGCPPTIIFRICRHGVRMRSFTSWGQCGRRHALHRCTWRLRRQTRGNHCRQPVLPSWYQGVGCRVASSVLCHQALQYCTLLRCWLTVAFHCTSSLVILQLAVQFVVSFGFLAWSASKIFWWPKVALGVRVI